MIPTTSDPLHFATNANLITFPAEVSHPHMVLQHGEEIFVPDLVRESHIGRETWSMT